MSKFEYTDEMVGRMQNMCASGVTEELILQLVDEFEFPRRSVTAKLRKLGFDVPRKPSQAPVFSDEETTELKGVLESQSGVLTAEEIAGQVAGGKFSARQINGKALSLEMTQHIKPAEKKVTPRTYTPEEEDTITKMVGNSAFIEDIAAELDKAVNSVRGKLLSMGLKAPQRDKKDAKSDAYAGIKDLLHMSVEDLASHFDKTPRGVKTVLTRRKLACADYTPQSVKDAE